MKIFIVLASLFAAAFSNADHRNDLRDVAHRLDRVTNNFLRQVEHNHHYRHITKEAGKLAWRASYFHEQVEHGASRKHLRKAFAKISRRYHDLVNEYRHEGYHNRYLERDLHRISRSFDRLSYAMNGGYYRSGYNQKGFYQRKRWGNNRNADFQISFSSR